MTITPDLNHDPLCPVSTMAPDEGGCRCSLVARVRSDERARLLDHLDIRRESLANLRAKVESLRDEAMDHHWADAIVAYQTVLLLIDGAGR